MEVEEKENEEEEEEEEKRGEEEEKESEDEGTKKVKGSSRKGSSRKSGRDSAEKKEPVTPSSDRPTRERKVVERYSAPSVARSSSFKLSIEKVFIVAVLAIFPLVPKSLSNRAYRLSFMGTACSSVYYLYALYGRPKAWTLQAVQVYFQSVIATKDFNYFIYCLTFVTSHLCLKFAFDSHFMPITRTHCKVLKA
ncbi:hypothetical protein ES332_A11G255600v1 [Gossypium tomentosum]|uniref:Uncharacterized protein n=1 Tax=Gossypium tomentosum TaxID=34277 RepID=A0A5D2NGJ7_GOSTO|nr:hypothetical protein ES332_A11G255600v1 [Gossypium tomentosum]